MVHRHNSKMILNRFIKLLVMVGIVSLNLVGPYLCSGDENFIKKVNYGLYQKFSTSKGIAYYREYNQTNNLGPGIHHLWVSNKERPEYGVSPIKRKKQVDWALSNIRNLNLDKSRVPQVEIPLVVPQKFLNNPLKNSRSIFLDYRERDEPTSKKEKNTIDESIVMLKILVQNKSLNKKWVVYVPFLYLSDEIQLPKEWVPKNLWYLAARELQRPSDGIGRYTISEGSLFIKFRLHKQIEKFASMRIYASSSQMREQSMDLGGRDLRIRTGFKDDSSYSEVTNIPVVLSRKNEDLISTAYFHDVWKTGQFKGQSKIFLQELTFNFLNSSSSLDLVKAVSKINLYSSSKEKLVSKLDEKSIETIFMEPRFIVDLTEGVRRLNVRADEITKITGSESEILGASLLADTHNAKLKKIALFDNFMYSKTLKENIKNKVKPKLYNKLEIHVPEFMSVNFSDLAFKYNPEAVVFESKSQLTWDEMSKLILRGQSGKVHSVQVVGKEADQFAKNLLYIILTVVILCIAFIMYAPKRYSEKLGKIEYKPVHVVYSGFFIYFLIYFYIYIYQLQYAGTWILLVKDTVSTFMGFAIALSWKYLVPDINKWLETTRPQLAKTLFKDSTHSYLTGCCAALFVCAVFRPFSSVFVEVFSSLSICFLVTGSYLHFVGDIDYSKIILKIKSLVMPREVMRKVEE